MPAPSRARAGEELIALPLSAWSKVLLLKEMVVQRVHASDLARRLEASPQTVNRLIDLHHVTKIDEVVRALGALGKRLDVTLQDA